MMRMMGGGSPTQQSPTQQAMGLFNSPAKPFMSQPPQNQPPMSQPPQNQGGFNYDGWGNIIRTEAPPQMTQQPPSSFVGNFGSNSQFTPPQPQAQPSPYQIGPLSNSQFIPSMGGSSFGSPFNTNQTPFGLGNLFGTYSGMEGAWGNRIVPNMNYGQIPGTPGYR